MGPLDTSVDSRVYFALGGVLGVVFLLWFLDAIFRREAVKADLLQRGCQTISISWRPFALWAPRYASTPFRVLYRDPMGRLHRARCSVYMALSSFPLGSREVEWLADEVPSHAVRK